MVPALAVQTKVAEPPVTVPVNWMDWPTAMAATAGVMLMPVGVVGSEEDDLEMELELQPLARMNAKNRAK
jgi:hypothetical protein